MRDNLEKLQATLHDLKKASVVKKGVAAEAALLATVALMEQMVAEIENLKRTQSDPGETGETDA